MAGVDVVFYDIAVSNVLYLLLSFLPTSNLKRQIIYLVKKVWWCPKKPVSLSQQNLKRYDEYECASMDSGDRSGLVGGPQRPLLAARCMDHQTRCCNHSSPFNREIGIESRNYG